MANSDDDERLRVLEARGIQAKGKRLAAVKHMVCCKQP